MSGAYDDALDRDAGAAGRAAAPKAIGRDACRAALDRLGESLAMRETAALLGDLDEARLDVDCRPSSTRSASPASTRSSRSSRSRTTTPRPGAPSELIIGFGQTAVSRLGSLVGDPRWFVQRRGARLLGTIGSADAVPLLQPLLRQSDPRVARAAVAALGVIDDPAAARAIHTVLRAATGEVAPRRHRRARRRPGSARRADAGAHPRGERAARQGSRGGARDDRRRSARSAPTPAVPTLRRQWRGARGSSAAGSCARSRQRSVDALVRIGRPRPRRRL